MPDVRFFSNQGPFELTRLAEISASRLAPKADGSRLIRDVRALEAAGPDDLSFFGNSRYGTSFSHSRAGACVVRPGVSRAAPKDMALVLNDDPYKAFALISRAFYPEGTRATGIDPGANVHPTAILGEGCQVAAGAVIGPGAELGANCTVGANCSLSHCLIGNNVTIHPGARIGQPGFGFAHGGGQPVDLPQLGRVIIEDDVEIGANTTVDRGSGPDTIIGAGCRIDNLVQIAHNVVLGRGCIIAAQCGIAGSTHLGDGVVVGGQAGFAGHLKIGDGARIAAKSGVMRDIPPGEVYGGSPAQPIRQWHRQTAWLNRLIRRAKREEE